MYNGSLAGYPTEIVDKMLERQFEQTGRKDVSVFEEGVSKMKVNGGFDWSRTPENHDFWFDVLMSKKFDVFYKRYPKNIKQKLEELIQLVPEKKQQLEKIFPEELKEPPLNVWKEIAKGDKWLIDNSTQSKNANLCLYTDDSDNVCLYLQQNFDWEIVDGNKLYAKYKK